MGMTSQNYSDPCFRCFELGIEQAKTVVADLESRFKDIDITVSSVPDCDYDELRTIHVLFRDSADKAYLILWASEGVEY